MSHNSSHWCNEEGSPQPRGGNPQSALMMKESGNYNRINHHLHKNSVKWKYVL